MKINAIEPAQYLKHADTPLNLWDNLQGMQGDKAEPKQTKCVLSAFLSILTRLLEEEDTLYFDYLYVIDHRN